MKQDTTDREVTRKLLVVELPHGADIKLSAKLLRQVTSPLVHEVYELPSAEELGRVALVTQCKPSVHSRACACVDCCTAVGQAILDALTKRTEGGEAK